MTPRTPPRRRFTSRLLARLLPRRFAASEDGSISVEAILIFPILAWAYMATYVFFDAFAALDTNVKAAYTIGDVLSRQTDYITPEFMDSMYALQDGLTDTPEQTKLRVTTFRFTTANNNVTMIWSQGRGGVPAHTTATLRLLRSRIPTMADNDVAVLTETWMDYHPPMQVGLFDTTFSELVVTRPRFSLNGRFCWNSLNDNGGPGTETC